MTDWHTIELKDVARLYPALESSVEMRTSYGKETPDWDRIITEVESSEEGLDLGDDMQSDVIKALLKHGREIVRELKER